MSKSNIEWTQETWNPIVGCSILSAGCIKCYAMGMARRIEGMNAANRAAGRPVAAPQYDGTTKVVNDIAVWTGKLNRAGDNILLAPLKRKKPTMYFVNSMSDLFHEEVPDKWIDQIFAVMALCPQHTFQVLTKRAKRMRAYFDFFNTHCRVAHCANILSGAPLEMPGSIEWPLPNVWLGVSTERQQEADERIPDLLATPAVVRFISAEPLLGPLDISPYLGAFSGIIWTIVGGESGPDYRAMNPDWARALRDQCVDARVPVFIKQMAGREPIPKDLQVRQFPAAGKAA